MSDTDPVCRYGFHSNHCELGYPGCGCADDVMAEIDRMSSVPHAYVEGRVPGIDPENDPGYPICTVCMGSKEMSVHGT